MTTHRKTGRARQAGKGRNEHTTTQSTYPGFLDYLLEGCQVMGFDWRFLYVNEVAARYSGRAREELIGRKNTEVFPGIEATEAFRVMKQCMDERVPTRNEYRVPFPDGSEQWFDISLQPVPEGIFILSQDITARKEAEIEARLVRERLEEAEQSAGFGSWEFDVRSGQGWWSPQMYRLFRQEPARGVPALETYLEAIHPQDRATVALAFESMAAGREPPVSEYRTNPERGSMRCLRPTAGWERDTEGRPVRYFGTVLDITEQKQAETHLREAQARLIHAVRSANVGLWEWDLRTNLVHFSPEWKKQLGYEDHEIRNDFSEWETRLHPQDEERTLATVSGYLANPYPNFHNEFRMRHKDGSYRWILAQAALDLDEEGKPIRMIGSHIDITASKQAEAELRQSRDRLEQLSRRLIEAQETERRAVGRELHDQIGQILTALKITLEISRQLPAADAAKKVLQAQELTDDLLNRVSRLSLELRPPMLDDLGLVPALDWHIDRFRAQTQIEVDFVHSGVEGRRFTTELETTVYRILQEGLTNAARHARAARIRLEVRKRGGGLEVEIEDDGVGFEPQSAFEKNRGLIGMRERASLMHGSFEVDSAPGRGTRTRIRLPVEEAGI